MGTILTVHGTFATGPEEGTSWWQRGSPSARQLQELIEAEDGQLKVDPFVWDGLNSELSRQKAALRLLERMTALDKAGERYCVIGHSHGGSVIAASLIQAAQKKRPLERLSRWITVGTPFIRSRQDRLTFSRLGPVGKMVLLSVVAYLFAFLYGSWRTSEGGLDRLWAMLIGGGFVLLLPMMIVYPFLWLWGRNRMPWHKVRTQALASKSFGARWLALRHEDDEAVQSLASLDTMKQPIFPRDFAVDGIVRLSTIIVPVAIVWAVGWLFAYTETSKRQPREPAAVTAPASPASPPPAAAQPPASAPQATTGAVTTSAPAAAKEAEDGSGGGLWILLVGLPIGIGMFAALPALVYYLVKRLAGPISHVSSILLNRMTWTQLQRASLGNDLEGERAWHASDHPHWLPAACCKLPAPLTNEISTISDEATAKSIAKFRAALSELGVIRIEDGGRDVLNSYLTGEELIHTTYFKVPRFRKLLAYAIAQSPGFRPSQAFRNDPELAVVKEWYESLVAGARDARPPSS